MKVYVVSAYLKYGSNALCVFGTLEEAQKWCKDNRHHRYGYCFHITEFELGVVDDHEDGE
jgi:hypothetical protein